MGHAVSTFIIAIYRFFGASPPPSLAGTMGMPAALMLPRATLTLPGIAGTTMGMAVDANVRSFSRIREEITAHDRCTAITSASAGYCIPDSTRPPC